MTIQQFEYIIALDNHRHFVTAANQCHVTQPALTIQVKKLEDELGIQIFDRSKHPLQPTKAGKEIILRARQVLRQLNHLKEYVLEEKNELSGEFRVGIIPTLAPYILPLLLPAFAQACPNVQLIIEEVQTFPMIDKLNRDLVDIAIMATPTGDANLREIPLFYEPFLGYIPLTHSLHQKGFLEMKDLNPKELLLLNKEHCYSAQLLSVCQASQVENYVQTFNFQIGSIETLKNLVKAGQGYSLIPELSMLYDPADPRIKRFQRPEPAREISLVVHQSFPKETLLKQMSQAILANIPPEYQQHLRYTRIKWNDATYLKMVEA